MEVILIIDFGLIMENEIIKEQIIYILLPDIREIYTGGNRECEFSVGMLQIGRKSQGTLASQINNNLWLA